MRKPALRLKVAYGEIFGSGHHKRIVERGVG